MSDPRLMKLADLLVNYSVGLEEDDWVVISGSAVTQPLVREVYRAALEAGAQPHVVMRDDTLTELKVRHGREEQLDWIPPVMETMMEEINAYINLRGTENTRQFSSLDPDRLSRVEAARRPIFERLVDRMGKGKLKYVLTRYPTQASAQEAEMSLGEYEDFLFSACRLDEVDPAAAWRAVDRRQARLVKWLEGKKLVEVKAKNADLRFSVEGRRFVNCSGRNNMPDGEIFTSPVEDSVEGWVHFSYPSIKGGLEVAGARLTLENGRVTAATAEKGEEDLLSRLDMDQGARRIGEFAIGTNWSIDRSVGDTLFDEKIGGTIHLALGHGIPEAGGVNKSGLHWDLVTDMTEDSRILADGELLYENGKFVVGVDESGREQT